LLLLLLLLSLLLLLLLSLLLLLLLSLLLLLAAWVSRLPLPDADAAPTLLGLDCEMCRTAENDKEVIQVALVDAQGRKILQV
jgi:hypothetical protein